MWIGTAEVARRLGVTPTSFSAFTDRVELPACRMGPVIRVQVMDPKAFIKSCRITLGTLA